MSVHVKFVCLGNICRSPTAHGLFAARVAQAGLADRIRVSSAGTGDWHVGKPPDSRSLEAARQRGFDLSRLRASQVQAADFGVVDYMLAMDRANLADLQRLAPAGYRGHLGLLLEFADSGDSLEVPDPYYGGEAGFERVLDLIEQAADGLLQHIQHNHLSGAG